MEKINSEILLSSLLINGFNQVDGLLYTYILGYVSKEKKQFEFDECPPSPIFNTYVDFDGLVCKLKDGFTMETDVSAVEDTYFPLRKALQTNDKLLDYLDNVDYRVVIMKKINALGIEKIDELEVLFSEKEKEIIKEMFGMKPKSKEKIYQK
jgi:hypothetical protein